MAMEFKPFPKIARLSREIVITEKLDGTNAAVVISEDGEISAQSRTRIITPQDDNFGFARWVQDNAAALSSLGAGYHFGEWWGAGIQRGYGLTSKRFSLFNVGRWSADNVPECCGVVPVLFRGEFTTDAVMSALDSLKANGSVAAPGFMNPEGIVVFHAASGSLFKKTIEKDHEWKGKAS